MNKNGYKNKNKISKVFSLTENQTLLIKRFILLDKF